MKWAQALSSLLCVLTLCCGHIGKRNSTGLTEAVTWDRHSLFIFGQRVFILAAEFHPWRQPNPNLWKDIFQKIKANGFNTVSFYVNWALHYPTPDSEDFQVGTYRDLQRFIDEAHAAGLWLIARPGPYINGETTGGGFPGWVGNSAGSLRTNNPNFTEAWQPYMNAISKLIARNQITEGGPIILVQAENEFSEAATHNPYMQAIIDTYRANGIVVPITFNDQHGGRDGNFSPDRGAREGAVNIYCGDSYPQGGNSWAQVQSVYYSNHQAVAPSNPLCMAEFGGGFLLSWGSGARGGVGYEKYSVNLTNADYENVFYKENYAQTTTILSIYMLYGGTNWGQTLEPTVYSSYDYGGGINENRVLTPKMAEMRLQGLFLRASRDLLSAELIANGTNYTTTSLIHTAELRNNETNGAFYIIRHDSTPSLERDTTLLNVSTSLGQLLIPKEGNITLNGRESKIIVTDYVFGESKTAILYSTAEVMTWTTIDKSDHIILYAPAGQTGETVLKFPKHPNVEIDGSSNIQVTWANGLLQLNYDLQGSNIVTISGLGPMSIHIWIFTKEVANTWHVPLIKGERRFANYYTIGTNETVLVGGPYLIREASISGHVLALTGDVNRTTTVEVIAPVSVKSITWNGAPISSKRTSYGALTFIASGSSSSLITLPKLGPWKVINSLPEVQPSFDDSMFVKADQTTTNYTNLPPLSGDVVLYSQQYGFYGGNLIFRGHFNATGTETAFNLIVQGGFAFGYSVFLNGVFLGSNQGTPSISFTTDTWTIPNDTLRVGEDNVLTVFQDHMGIVETSTNGGKEPRGIRGYSIIGSDARIIWKLQGNLGGSGANPDKFRGYLNEGGLYAERIGAHLPGFDDSQWQAGHPSDGIQGVGVNFYRTTFSMDSSKLFVDMPIRLSITPSAITSNFRIQVYINGWQVGKYINNIGPQTLFVLPSGLLRRRSPNTLAVSLWSLDGKGASIAGLELVSDGVFISALPFDDYTDAPDYGAQQALRPHPTYFKPV